MDEKRLQEIKQRAEALDAGEWHYVSHPGNRHVYADVGDIMVAMVCHIYRDDDGEFIAHAREDIPYLIGEIEQLKELLDFNANLNAKIIVDMGRVSTENDNLRTEIERLRVALEMLADESSYTMRLSGYTGDMMWDATEDEHPWDYARRKIDESLKGGE